MVKIKRKCSRCGKTYYCHGECKNKIKILPTSIEFCYCGPCYLKVFGGNLSAHSTGENCETRFGESATKRILDIKEKVVFT